MILDWIKLISSCKKLVRKLALKFSSFSNSRVGKDLQQLGGVQSSQSDYVETGVKMVARKKVLEAKQ